MRLFYFFKMADFTGLYKMLQTAANYGFKTLMDSCVIVDRLLPSSQTPENRELKQRRRQKQRKRHLKIDLYFICATSR